MSRLLPRQSRFILPGNFSFPLRHSFFYRATLPSLPFLFWPKLTRLLAVTSSLLVSMVPILLNLPSSLLDLVVPLTLTERVLKLLSSLINGINWILYWKILSMLLVPNSQVTLVVPVAMVSVVAINNVSALMTVAQLPISVMVRKFSENSQKILKWVHIFLEFF